MDKKELEKRIDELYELLMKPETKEDWKKLLADLCTYTEIEQMARRAYAAKLFLEGNTYNSIIAETELSSATLSRVSRCLNHGSGGSGIESFVLPSTVTPAASTATFTPEGIAIALLPIRDIL